MASEIVINNALISYSVWPGEDQGQTLLFLHGWRSSKEVWETIVNQVIKLSSYQVYAIDLPGFGGSPAPREAWSMRDYAEVVSGFIEKLELKNVILVGHSFGGRVGIKLCADTTLPLDFAQGTPPWQEGRISKLVLVDSAGFANPAKKKTLMHFGAQIARPFFKPKFMQPLRKKIYKAIGAEDYLATPELQETFRNIVNEDLTEDLKRIKIPTLIVWGEDDQETPLSFGEKMHSLIQRSSFSIIKNAGHFSFLDRPEEFVEILTNFISGPNTPN